MSAQRTDRRAVMMRLAACVLALVLLSVVSAPSSAQVDNVSEPATAYPRLPDVTGTEPEISDLVEAPPDTREAIVRLVMLGIYPVTTAMEARPNEPLDAATAAYMLVNAFALSQVTQYPVSSEEALGILAMLPGADLAEGDAIDVGTFRDLIVAIVLSDAGRAVGLALGTILDRQYPALAAGNPEAPLTRAGAALMTAFALEALAGPSR